MKRIGRILGQLALACIIAGPGAARPAQAQGLFRRPGLATTRATGLSAPTPFVQLLLLQQQTIARQTAILGVAGGLQIQRRQLLQFAPTNPFQAGQVQWLLQRSLLAGARLRGAFLANYAGLLQRQNALNQALAGLQLRSRFNPALARQVQLYQQLSLTTQGQINRLLNPPVRPSATPFAPSTPVNIFGTFGF